MYQVGEYVVKANAGICQVVEIVQMTTDSSGNTIIRYTCSGCNQTFEITFQAENE